MKRNYIVMTISIVSILAISYLFYYRYNNLYCYNKNALGSYTFIIDDKDIYRGLDLSHHNTIVAFDGLSKYDFIYHKATEGSTFMDPKFDEREEKFIKMGIPYGAYHFFTTTSSGKEQFSNFKNNVSKGCPLIPVLDIEINKNKWSVSKLNKEIADWITLCEKHYGVKPIIYSSSWFYIRY